MSKIETLSPISSSYAGITKLNAHLVKITTALQNTVSRDGSSPNQMEADLDLNDNRVINVADPVADGDIVNKGYVDSLLENLAALSDLSNLAGQPGVIAISDTNAVVIRTYSYITGTVDPLHFGATGNGIVDDKAFLNTALAYAVANGYSLDLKKRTYGVSGNWYVQLADAVVTNGTIKQLTPGDETTTVYINAHNVRFEKVKIDRNGDGTKGLLNYEAGLYGRYCNDLNLIDVSVTGNDAGNGVILDYCVRPNVTRLKVDGMKYAHVAQTDDTIHGIWFRYCVQALLADVYIGKLGRINQAAAQRDRYSRGVVASGCHGLLITNPTIYRCDQQIDISSSDSNVNVSVIGGNLRFAHANGVKFANTAINCSAVGTVIDSPGFRAVTVSGPSSNTLNPTRDILIADIIAHNVGAMNASTGLSTTTNIFPFAVERGTGAPAAFAAYPKNIRFDNCHEKSDSGSVVASIGSLTRLDLAITVPFNFSNGVRVRFTSSGTLPTGLALATDYWIKKVLGTNFINVCTSWNNFIDAMEADEAGLAMTTIISTFSGGSGTHTMTLQQDYQNGFENTVAAADLDPTAPNIVTNSSASGYANKEFNGFVAPFTTILNSNPFPVADSTSVVLAIDEGGTANSDLYGAYSSGVFTAPFSKAYRCTAVARFAANSTGLRRLFLELDTGSGYAQVPGVYYEIAGQGGSSETPLHLSAVLSLAKGHKVRWVVRQNSGGSLSINIDCRLEFIPITDYGVNI